MMQRIGIALIEHEGAVLVGVRGPDSTLPGKAEFPGESAYLKNLTAIV